MQYLPIGQVTKSNDCHMTPHVSARKINNNPISVICYILYVNI